MKITKKENKMKVAIKLRGQDKPIVIDNVKVAQQVSSMYVVTFGEIRYRYPLDSIEQITEEGFRVNPDLDKTKIVLQDVQWPIGKSKLAGIFQEKLKIGRRSSFNLVHGLINSGDLVLTSDSKLKQPEKESEGTKDEI